MSPPLPLRFPPASTTRFASSPILHEYSSYLFGFTDSTQGIIVRDFYFNRWRDSRSRILIFGTLQRFCKQLGLRVLEFSRGLNF